MSRVFSPGFSGVKLSPGDPPSLHWQLEDEHLSLSWAIQGNGYQKIRELIWLQVKNSDLPEGLCPKELIKTRGVDSRALVFLTSANIDSYQEVSFEKNGIVAHAVATTGLGNALRAGDPTADHSASRTINLACRVNVCLSPAAMLEALSIMTEGKTAAMIEASIKSRVSGELATGTGTDCQAILALSSGPSHDYAGKHTEVGSLIGRACLEVMRLGILSWHQEVAQRLLTR